MSLWISPTVRSAADAVDLRVLTPAEQSRVHDLGYGMSMSRMMFAKPWYWVAAGVWFVGALVLLALLFLPLFVPQWGFTPTVLALVGLILWLFGGLPVLIWISYSEGTANRLRALDGYLQSIGYGQRLVMAQQAWARTTWAAPPPPSSPGR